VLPGSQILLYPVLWILMPSEDGLGYYPPQASPQSPPPAPPTAV
jgi:phage shock protein C